MWGVLLFQALDGLRIRSGGAVRSWREWNRTVSSTPVRRCSSFLSAHPRFSLRFTAGYFPCPSGGRTPDLPYLCIAVCVLTRFVAILSDVGARGFVGPLIFTPFCRRSSRKPVPRAGQQVFREVFTVLCVLSFRAATDITLSCIRPLRMRSSIGSIGAIPSGRVCTLGAQRSQFVSGPRHGRRS